MLYKKKAFDLTPGKIIKLSKMIQNNALLMQNIYYKKKIQKLIKAVNIDSLTGLNDHRSFHESITKELLKANRFKYSIVVIMLDIDHFKRFNDLYGHPVGDEVLRIISSIIRKYIRSYDQPYRYGGEEFAIICPYTTRRKAIPLAERIRKAIENYPFKAGRAMEKVKLTASMGIASYPENALTRTELVGKADQALYLAKEEGRNRISTALISKKKKIKFAYCPPAFTSPYYLSVLRGIHEVMEDVGNIEFFTDSPDIESDIKRHMEIIESYIEMKVDSIAICSHDKELLGKTIKKCNKAGINVFMFNTTENVPSGDVTAYISYNNKEAGRKVGKYITWLLRKKGKVAVIEGLGSLSSNQRKSGFMQEIKKYRNIKVAASMKADWLKKKAFKVTEKIIKKYPDIAAIYAVSDEMALGAAEAIKKAGKNGEIFTIGLDGYSDSFIAIKEGLLTATLNTNAIEMGRTLMRTILRSKIKGEKIEKRIWLPIMMVVPENVENFL